MRNVVYAGTAIALCGTVLVAGRPPGTRPPVAPPARPAVAHPASTASVLPIDAQNKLVAQYCATCHSEKGHAGELSLASFDAAKVTDHADVGEKMIRRLRAGMMPPPGARRPDAATLSAFVDVLETTLDTAAALSPNPGWRPVQRPHPAE